jgi:hypothetical protein
LHIFMIRKCKIARALKSELKNQLA